MKRLARARDRCRARACSSAHSANSTSSKRRALIDEERRWFRRTLGSDPTPRRQCESGATLLAGEDRAHVPGHAPDPPHYARSAVRRSLGARGRARFRPRGDAPSRQRQGPHPRRGRGTPPTSARDRRSRAGAGFLGGVRRRRVRGLVDPRAAGARRPGSVEGQAELGYRILRRHWRNGFASEELANSSGTGSRTSGCPGSSPRRWRSMPDPARRWLRWGWSTFAPSSWTGTSPSPAPSRVKSSTRSPDSSGWLASNRHQ